MTIALAIFVKTPGHSALKTRLASSHGQRFAERWHRRAAAAVASVARQVQLSTALITPYWGVAEADALQHPLWADLPRVAQGEGDLGTRLAAVHDRLITQHSAVILIGADSPQLSAEPLLSAVFWLREPGARAVLGPAIDGGFWIVGTNVPLPRHVWTQVRYSGRETGNDMRCSLSPHARCLSLPRLLDVDTRHDLAPLRSALAELPFPTAEQQSLLRWLHAAPEAVPA